MDEIKDIAEKSQTSKLLDSTIIRTDAFGKNISGDRAYRRAERIVAAIHLITNHIPFQEPARLALRSSGVRLLSAILGLRSEMRAPGSVAISEAVALVRKLISLARVILVSGHVSPQN